MTEIYIYTYFFIFHWNNKSIIMPVRTFLDSKWIVLYFLHSRHFLFQKKDVKALYSRGLFLSHYETEVGNLSSCHHLSQPTYQSTTGGERGGRSHDYQSARKRALRRGRSKSSKWKKKLAPIRNSLVRDRRWYKGAWGFDLVWLVW